MPNLGRKAAIVGTVVLLHGLVLWALQQALVRPPEAVVVPAQILVELIAPRPPQPAVAAAPMPAPEPAPPEPPRAAEPPPPPPPPPKPRSAPPPPRPRPAPARPVPVVPARPVTPAAAPAIPEAVAPTPEATPAAAPETASAGASAPMAATVSAAAPVAPAPAPTPVVVQPSSSAAYLNNPPPRYPPLSQRLGESGRVVVRVLIGTDGRALDARIQRSSGYQRLDQVALETARDHWRYVPGTRGGTPEAMWFNVPINFVLR